VSILANTVNLFGLKSWFGRGKKRSSAARSRPVAFVQEPKKLSATDQWDRISGVMSAAITSATSARELQASAAQQLDLATYALYNLFDELTAVMSEPLVREAAVVHRLQPRASRRGAAALAA